MITKKHISGGLEALQIQEHDLVVTVVPFLGAKISSILWKGRELLALNPSRKLQPALYAAPYADYDASGFDECFPTIGACLYPDDPWKGAEVPDHGEVWSIPWAYREEAGSLHLDVHGIHLPYLFEKTISIAAPGEIHFHYTLTNLSNSPLKYLWSSHPLLAPQPGMRILLPEGVRVRVDWSKDGRLGEMWAEHSWPLTTDCQGLPVDLSLILSESARLVDKLYTTQLTQGWCALHDPSSGFFTAFRFSPQQIPYVGLSINLGGWPVDESGQTPGYYNLGLEPCSGYPDRLDLAVEKGKYQTLQPQASTAWDMSLFAGETDDIWRLISTWEGSDSLDD